MSDLMQKTKKELIEMIEDQDQKIIELEEDIVSKTELIENFEPIGDVLEYDEIELEKALIESLPKEDQDLYGQSSESIVTYMSDKITNLLDLNTKLQKEVEAFEAKFNGLHQVQLRGHWKNHKPNEFVNVDYDTLKKMRQAGIIY